ncbi:hypothetical protein, partial [Raoultibacter timonensis]|uniref:hypothetical protein n=1 Tax=Raoultibacter timonensis TaxID=1907662 RepID=UPI0026DDB165
MTTKRGGPCGMAAGWKRSGKGRCGFDQSSVRRGRPPAGGLPCFAPEGAKQTLFLGAYIPMTPTMNGIQAAMIS